MNYYRRYSGDYLRDTARLTLTEHGAYCLLMDYYYTDEKPLPSDHQELYLMLRAMRPEDRKAVDRVLDLFFKQEPDGYHQKRIDHEIGVSKKARDNGKYGGRPKTGNITGLETETETGGKTESVTGEGGGSGHPPTTNHQPPSTSHQPPPNQPPKKENRARKRAMPPDFGISDRVKAWASEKGYDRIAEHLDAFKRKAAAGGYAYVDWDSAFMEAVREDWAKLRGNGKGGNGAPPPIADGKITCISCGARVSSYTGRQCDPCWRGERRVAV